MEQAEFLSRQFDLLSQRLTDPAIEWQDIADLRAEHTGEDEHRDTIRKGAKLFYEYLGQPRGYDGQAEQNQPG